ncbi:MAG: hypothetical protein LBE92_02570 [Chryseobacterium sp.]|jgi:hypothetical protein|uniref:S41 family peptidase n=1 Tax=Chryseobacterium sp. TaxID=1871047 RepID=UPI002833D77A|nr:S41 family peptidase [Chryseobacterium sp.]MDR2234984.1 hypothetical protein [Chryseobacterium sp.]
MTQPSLICFLALFQSAFGQKTLVLPPGDTLNYSLTSKKPAWISIRSDDANLAFTLFEAGKKIKDQDDSKGIGSLERLYHIPQKNKTYTLKIWSKSYIEQSKPAEVKITESARIPVSNSHFTPSAFLEDLKAFRSIREQANAGLYLYRTKKQIDSLYSHAEKEAENCKSILDFYKIIARLTEFEGSCHNFTDLPDNASYYLTQKAEYLPVTLKNINGRLLQDSEDIQIPVGAEIVSINDIPAAEIIRRLSQYYSSDGFSTSYKETAGFEKGMLDKFYIEFGTHPHYSIRYQWKNRIHQTALPGISYEDAKKLQNSRYSLVFRKKLMAEKYSFTKEEDGVYRLSVRSFDFATGKEDPAYKKFGDFLDGIMQTLEKENVKHLIIDLRGNSGGTGALYEKVFTYLTQQPFRDSRYAYTLFNEIPVKESLVITPMFISNGIRNGSGLDVYLKQLYPESSQGKFYWTDEKNPLIFPSEKTFSGQLYLFVDENVASAGSHLASLIKSFTNAIVIGNETNGGYYEHNGHLPVVYELPNTRIQTGFSIVHVIQDARILPDQKTGRGIIPHFQVRQTDQEFLDHTDAYMKKLFEIKKP